MSMRKREGATILDRFDPALDPGNLCRPMGKPKAEPICYCPVLPKNMRGGMQPAIDLKEHRIACRVCGKTIPKSCGRASVRHLRGLLNAKPEHVDFAAIPDLLL